VPVASDIECGYQDPRSGKWRQKLPVAVDVAVPVETAAKPGAGKFLYKEIKVGFGEPSRQSRDRLHSGEKAAPPRDHSDGAGSRGRLARDRAEDGAHRMADIALELSLGHTRGLKVELVKDRIVALRHDRGRTRLTARAKRHAEADHPTEAVGAQQPGEPRHRRTPIMAGNHPLPHT